MFSTSSESQIRLPREMVEDGSFRWRLVESIGAGFFVARMRFRKDEPLTSRTAMLCWDSDVVYLVEAPNISATLISLHYFSSSKMTRAAAPVFREIHEIWRGVDTAAHQAEVIIFKTTDGTEFCGPQAIPVPPSVLPTALIATIAPETDGSSQ